MNEKQNNWEDLRLFVSVAEEGGLSPAAKITGRSAATLGRRMLALERRLKRELFVRHERGYELTNEGKHLLKELKDVEDRISRVTNAADEKTLPLVKVSAGTWTTLALINDLGAITGKPPDLKTRFMSAETVLDIPHREITIGFRNKRPTENALAGRKLSNVEFAGYSTSPKSDKWIKVLADTPSARWLEKNIGNDVVCEVSSPRNALDLALAGQGIALLPTFIGDTHNGLSQVGNPISELAHDQWIVTHQDDRHLPEVRRAINRMCTVLKTRTPQQR